MDNKGENARWKSLTSKREHLPSSFTQHSLNSQHKLTETVLGAGNTATLKLFSSLEYMEFEWH